VISSATTTTLGYWDVEPNLHFFKLYQKALEELDQIESPRADRTQQLGCDSFLEFKAKVHCIRNAFTQILEVNENQEYFKEMGKEILEILLNHTLRVTICVRIINNLVLILVFLTLKQLVFNSF
jgi:hypothetical protein